MTRKSLMLLGLLGSVSLASSQAFAGGTVGGDCCADLEERVAELEATTVRKGNRKVTLSIFGNVHRALLFSNSSKSQYDKDVMITDTYANQTMINLLGGAQISRDFSVGYALTFRIGEGSNNGLIDGFEQDGAIDTAINEIFFSSKTYGNLSIGLGSTASEYAGEQDLSGTNYIAGGSISHYNAAGNIDGFGVRERIMYATPSVAGFQLAASWQENSDWDAALSYQNKHGNFTVAAKIAYFELGEEKYSAFDPGFGILNGLGYAAKGDNGYTGSASILHNPTGLSLTFAGGKSDAAALSDPENSATEFWYIKAGLQRNLIDLGKTYFSVDYHDMETIFGDVEKVGFQVVQDIDAAAMKVYLSYWNADQKTDPLQTDINDQAVMIGANIDF